MPIIEGWKPSRLPRTASNVPWRPEPVSKMPTDSRSALSVVIVCRKGPFVRLGDI